MTTLVRFLNNLWTKCDSLTLAGYLYKNGYEDKSDTRPTTGAQAKF